MGSDEHLSKEEEIAPPNPESKLSPEMAATESKEANNDGNNIEIEHL